MDGLLGDIYDAALDPQKWPEVLGRVAGRVGAASASFFSAHSESQRDAVAYSYNHAPEMLQEFGSYWHAHDEWALGARRHGFMRRGPPLLGTQLVEPDHLVKTDFYNEFCRKHDMHALLGGVLFDGSEADAMPFTNICWYRPAGQELFDASHKEQLEALYPHFRRALRIQRRIDWLADTRAQNAFSALRLVSVLLDRDARILHQSEEAEGFVRTLPAGGYVHGQLRSIGTRCNPSVLDAIAAAAEGPPVRMVGLLHAARPRLIGATLMRMPDTTGNEHYLLLVELPRDGGDTVAQAVAPLFGLSRSETRALAGLLDGLPPSEIAANAGVSITTVRTQLSTLLAKTGTSGQAQLLAMLRDLRL